MNQITVFVVTDSDGDPIVAMENFESAMITAALIDGSVVVTDAWITDDGENVCLPDGLCDACREEAAQYKADQQAAQCAHGRMSWEPCPRCLVDEYADAHRN
jgi:hypothetical protein